MREGPRGAQSDRKGVGRSRGQGKTVSHRPESSSELSGSLYTLSLSCSRMHLRAVAGVGCKGVDGGATFTAEAQPATASVPRGTAHAMDAGLPVQLQRCIRCT